MAPQSKRLAARLMILTVGLQKYSWHFIIADVTQPIISGDFLDDILIASESATEHKEHLRILIDRLEEHGLVVKKEKCLFGVSEIDFLGHRVDSNGIRPYQQKSKLLQNSLHRLQ